jgi:predicted O-methyltransferase YrrM
MIKMNGQFDFGGANLRTARNWFPIIQKDSFSNRPINYLEIGTFYGANVISVAKTYASHPESRLYCIDPWEDYNDYPQFKNKQETTYNTFMNNIRNSGEKDRINIIRGYSSNEIPKFEDNFFDIIYIDGNHEPEYVMEDAVLSFIKLKVGGIMIFDDYGWGGPDLTKRGIDGFLNGYHKRLQVLRLNHNTQTFVRKISGHSTGPDNN